MSAAEDAVRELDRLRAAANKVDGWMRSMRLGQGVETTDDRPPLRRLRMRAGVYGGGWLTATAERLPSGMEHEFYAFLSAKAGDLGRQIREAQAVLDKVDV